MSLSCNLKAQQKVFLLHQALAHSCCRGYPVEITNNDTYHTVSQHWLDEKQQLDNNTPVESCQVCWRDEQNGVTSYRQIQGQLPEQYSIHLGFSNACNHMCSYCLPKYSSIWQKSIDVHGKFIGISRSAQLNLESFVPAKINVDQWMHDIQQEINSQPDGTVVLALTGGEPLMQKDSLKQILELSSAKIKRININTNLNPPDNKFLQWILEHFPNHQLHFEISLDATLEFNHVPRSGFDAKKFQENIVLLQNKAISFRFLAVCSVLNFFDLPNYHQWINENHFSLTHFKLNNPDCLDPVWIPPQFTQPILNQLDIVPDVIKNLNHPRQTVDLKLKEQYNYLTQYFERTGTQISNTVFEPYWNWLKEQNENSIGI